MGATLSSIISWVRCTEPHRIMMFGLDGAGKTTILYKIKLGEVVQTIPTIGCNVETVEHGNVSLRAWDLNTNQRLRLLWRHYFPDTSAFIFVVDSAASERFAEAKEELHRLVEESELKEDCPFSSWPISKIYQRLPRRTSSQRPLNSTA
ncbi:uncharacterized protein [Macrobrachium rosenbergii]|uniref:uncharacterized protein n=1 Tax=Macrobrachium rosenbergii TaxID=79674 RepID=UPI0034D5437C